MNILQMMGETQARLKYGRYLPEESRREQFPEIVDRYFDHVSSHTWSADLLMPTRDLVLDRKVLPSMRLMQFAGEAASLENARGYNCSFLHIDSVNSFAEMMYLSLCGTGVGFTVLPELIANLPRKQARSNELVISIPDTKEGWAWSISDLINETLDGHYVIFDYSKIRKKGTPLVTSGGKAPGHEPLMRAHNAIRKICMDVPEGSRLSTVDCYDICCHAAGAVLAGGIRRSAMICLFDKDDSDMLYAKTKSWMSENPQRAYSNNSVILDRDQTTFSEFLEVLDFAKSYGEPGIYWTNNRYWGTNPCVEIGLKNRQFCNLTEVNVSDLSTQDELLKRIEAATVLGTLQASLTSFNDQSPLSKLWKINSEEEALLGVSMTGISSRPFINALKNGNINLKAAAQYALYINEKVAKAEGINKAARVTCVKPAGTTSIVMGTSSGIHAWHSNYFLRRVTVRKEDPLYLYMQGTNPGMVEDSVYNAEEAYILFPCKAPSGSLVRSDETAKKLITRATRFYKDWVVPGHRTGDNTHNISCTVSMKDDEWETAGNQMWDSRYNYNGLALIKFDPKSYPQTPFEEITKERHDEMIAKVQPIDLSQLKEVEDNTTLSQELACAGGACEI